VRGVHAARRLVCHDIWPGKDLVFTEESGGIAYELRRTDGAVPGVPRFTFEGQERVEGMPGETRTIITSAGSIRLDAEDADGSTGLLRPVVGPPTLSKGPRDPCALDPAADPGSLAWSTFLGGWTYEASQAVATSVQGTVTVAGCTSSDNFPVTPGAYSVVFNHGFPGESTDGFVGRFSATGSELLWCTYIGGYLEDYLFGLVLDREGNAIITGDTYSPEFATTQGAFEPSIDSGSAAFISSISADGSRLLPSTYLGGGDDGWASANSVALDASGNIVVKGITGGPAFPTTPGAFDRTFDGGGFPGSDAFLSKLSSDCTSLIWSTFLGGSGDEGTAGDELDRGLAVDGDGSVVVTGSTASEDFPVTPGAWHASLHVGGDSFVARVSADGSSLVWSTYLGGTTTAGARGLVLDDAGNVILAGWMDHDAFVAELASSGTTAIWNTVFGGSDFDSGRGVSALLSPFGGPPLWSSYFGGDHDDTVSGAAFDSAGNPILAGTTWSGNLPITPGAYDSTGNGQSDVFAGPVPGCHGRLLRSLALSRGEPDHLRRARA
jgi:hypothetical protein